jgi:hypothetical protein
MHKEKKDRSFVLKLLEEKEERKKGDLDEGVVKSSIRRKMDIDGC